MGHNTMENQYSAVNCIQAAAHHMTTHLQHIDGAESEPEGNCDRKDLWHAHTMHGVGDQLCVEARRASLRYGYSVCVGVCASTQSHDLHLQIKNNILVWTPGTDSETNKLQAQTQNESNIELHFRTETCPRWLQRLVQHLQSRGNRSVSEKHPTGPDRFKYDQTGHIISITPLYTECMLFILSGDTMTQ